MVILFLLVIPVNVPWQKVSLPLHTALASHCLTRDPFSINPGSHANVNEFGKVVRYCPTKDPLTGTRRKPQSFAIGKRIHDSKQFLRTKISYEPFSYFESVSLPSQKVPTPLHTPSDLHSLTFEPFKSNPSSHVNVTLLGYVVRFPCFVPFKGVSMDPQSLANLNHKNKRN